MKKKYLPLYYKWMKQGRIPNDGLCNSLDYSEEFRLYFANNLRGYWGYNGESTHNLCEIDPEGPYKFTPLRQNIVLFLAAMNGEL